MLLRLTDGTTTVTMSGSGAFLGATYFPTRGDESTVSETFTVVLEGDASTIRAAVNDVEQLLDAARWRKQNMTARVWLEFRPVDSGDIFRSEVFDGAVKWPAFAVRRNLYMTTNAVEISVVVQRRNEWEGPEEEAYLSSSTQTERIGGVTLYNNDNAGAPNWAGLASNRVKGTRPAPVRIVIANASGGTISWRNMYIGNNVFSAPTSADVWLLGSEATSPGAAASWAGGIDHNSRMWTIPLSATLLGQTQGRRFRVLAAFTSISNAGSMRASVGTWISSVYGAQQIGTERLVSATGQLVDLGLFALPPGGYNVANSSAALVLSVRSSLAGSATLDFVQLMPTDSFRQLTQNGYSAANGDAMVDDGIEGATYLLNGSNKLPLIVAAGDPLKIYPERTQRLHFLFEENGLFVAGRQLLCSAFYRPIYDNI